MEMNVPNCSVLRICVFSHHFGHNFSVTWRTFCISKWGMIRQNIWIIRTWRYRIRNSVIQKEVVDTCDGVVNWGEEGICFPDGLRSLQGSDTVNSDMESWITWAEIDKVVGLKKVLSKSRSNLQLKSPPSISIWENKLGSLEKTDLKKSSLAQLGA